MPAITMKHLEGQLRRLHNNGCVDLAIEQYNGYRLITTNNSLVSPGGLSKHELYLFMAGMNEVFDRLGR